MKILIVTSCTGEKAVESDRALTLDDFRQGGSHLKGREKALAKLRKPAAELYTGQQHVRLMRGVEAINASRNGTGPVAQVGLWVLSAGYGLVPGDRKLSPYETTFQGMKARELRDWSDHLNVPADFRKLVADKYDLCLVLLGDSYLSACKLDDTVEFGGQTLLFCGNGMAKKLPRLANVRVVTLSNPEATRFSCGLVGLKGEVAARLLTRIANKEIGSEDIEDASADVLTLIESDTKTLSTNKHQKRPTNLKRELGGVASLQPPKARFAVHTPRKSAEMQYFIPEWDDRVDPDYNFHNDGITPDRDPYNHDVYAHEIYKQPNYDGILVSKSVIEDNQKKKARIRAIGIHAHVRVPRSFPVMGDCGAFNYINDFEPPYSTEETVHFYQSLDFDFGVSIDHLIVPQHLQVQRHMLIDESGTERELTPAEFEQLEADGTKVNKSRPSKRLFASGREIFTWMEDDLTEAKRRWHLTAKNSEEFIAAHKHQGATFVPIAGCQGWDASSQAEMFAAQQDMGYSYIALGGLVRSQTKDIVEILETVGRIRKPSTKIHLFGVARPEAIPTFMKLGVNSIDSARFLRQAWLSATSNYYSGDPTQFLENAGETAAANCRYTALRIPPIYREGSTTVIGKAKKLVNEGYPIKDLEAMEKKTLELVHAFDREESSIEETLTAIIQYDQLMGGDIRNAALYRRVLEDRPWKQCPCDVCQKTGIDVVIFRRNNRNRRRGFHNTWWFFEFFKHATTGNKIEV